MAYTVMWTSSARVSDWSQCLVPSGVGEVGRRISCRISHIRRVYMVTEMDHAITPDGCFGNQNAAAHYGAEQ